MFPVKFIALGIRVHLSLASSNIFTVRDFHDFSTFELILAFIRYEKSKRIKAIASFCRFTAMWNKKATG